MDKKVERLIKAAAKLLECYPGTLEYGPVRGELRQALKQVSELDPVSGP